MYRNDGNRTIKHSNNKKNTDQNFIFCIHNLVNTKKYREQKQSSKQRHHLYVQIYEIRQRTPMALSLQCYLGCNQAATHTLTHIDTHPPLHDGSIRSACHQPGSSYSCVIRPSCHMLGRERLTVSAHTLQD